MSKEKKSPFGVICLLLLLVIIIGSIISTGKPKKETPMTAATETVTTTNVSTTVKATARTTTETTQEGPIGQGSVPYVGMKEYMLNTTSLREPTEIELCRDYYSLRPERRSKTYIWRVDGVVIFSAHVLVDTVISVYDNRTPPPPPKNYSHTKKHTTHRDNDPYHAKDYDNADDFYDDYYGDFEDFEDAEDYYDSHD